MEPIIKITSEENNTLFFTMSNINHSLANSLRRIILSDIPTLVFRTFPHNESKVDITINTTRLNNQIIKQRIGCIPIHITDTDFPYKDYVVEVDKKNETDTIQLLTTADFKIKNISTDKYLSPTAVKEIFPPDSLTGGYIPITRLRPKLSENIEGEHIQFTGHLDIGTAKQDGMYNIVSTCAYGATMDVVKETMFGMTRKRNWSSLVCRLKILISKRRIGFCQTRNVLLCQIVLISLLKAQVYFQTHLLFINHVIL